MGYDSFGLYAEQYAIETGQHPEITTTKNIKRYKEQLDKIGFSFDWDREIQCLILHIINGHNGFLNNYLTHIIVTLITELSPYLS